MVGYDLARRSNFDDPIGEVSVRVVTKGLVIYIVDTDFLDTTDSTILKD